MSVEASTLPVIEHLTLLDDLRRFRPGARECAGFSPLVAGTNDCIMCRSAAQEGMAKDTVPTSNGNIPRFITFSCDRL
jgi:hypothetical protein